jgi:predicted nucleic acid-binding protein
MSAEFVDTNILVYAHDGGAGDKHSRSVELLARLFGDQTGAISVQVLAEFYAVAVKKLGMTPEQAEDVIADLGTWTIHRPGHADVIRASRLYRRHKLAWWDAMVVNSAVELGCGMIWSEDLVDGQRYSTVVARNPFR